MGRSLFSILFEKMSKYNLIRREAFIYGECIFVIEEYLSLSQIRFEKLLQFIPRNHILGFALTYEFSISTIVEVAM